MSLVESKTLVRPLFDGPIDIVGDVHGEIDAIGDLMRHLGYDDEGTHREGRRLVFVGDLTDRGPDSPAVFRLVRRLVESGQAQCVLGNHDLNILLETVKRDNHWYFPAEVTHGKSGVDAPAIPADDTLRQEILLFFRTLPLVLERPDLRVVHASWDDRMIAAIRNETDARALHDRHKTLIAAGHAERSELDATGKKLELQNRNPVKLLTSGPERRAKAPFHAGGKVLEEERVSWWESYTDPTLCVFGHYGFTYGKEPRSGRAVCVDFNVGKRFAERQKLSPGGSFATRLGALRMPEGVLLFDDGEFINFL